MQITRVFQKNDDGTYTFEMAMTEEQVGFLVNFALGQLVTAGVASYLDVDAEGEEFDSSELDVAQNAQETPPNTKLN